MAKILIIDDSQSIRENLEEILQNSGHATKTAQDGLDGLELIKNELFDVVFCDMNMPNMDGLTMVEQLAKLEDVDMPNIFMLTAQDASHLKSRAKAAGVKGWIVKPVDAKKVLLVVEKSLEMRKGA